MSLFQIEKRHTTNKFYSQDRYLVETFTLYETDFSLIAMFCLQVSLEFFRYLLQEKKSQPFRVTLIRQRQVANAIVYHITSKNEGKLGRGLLAWHLLLL